MPQPASQDEVVGYFQTLSNWGRWGAEDRLGTLNLITPQKRVQAAAIACRSASRRRSGRAAPTPGVSVRRHARTRTPAILSRSAASRAPSSPGRARAPRQQRPVPGR